MGALAVSAPAAAPSVCAGLQQVLQQGWRASFPLRASPWPEMAAAVGASSRELLTRAQQLQRARQLQPVQVRWGEALRRQRWRLRFQGLDAPGRQALQREAQQLPAALCIEWVASVEDRAEAWLQLEAREAATLAHAREQLEATLAQAASSCWVLQQQPEPCGCADGHGPCADTRLAKALEQQGLALTAHPYAALAARLGDRSERELLARLRDWLGRGWLRRLVLTPPFVPHEQRWQRWVLPPSAALPPGFLRQAWTAPATGEQGWLLSAAGDSPAPPLAAPPLAHWHSRVLRLRPQALLFG